MKISIIISAYNVADYITTCLESIEFQSYHNIEVIIVDDGSSDGTAYVINEYKKKTTLDLIFVRQTNRGVQAARQKGFNVATGHYILWMDSDDWLEKNALESLVENIKQSQADLICFDFQFVRSDGRIRSSALRLEKLKKENLTSCLLTGILNGALWNKLIRREFLLKNQVMLPQSLRYGEDLASLILISTLNPSLSVINKVLYNYYLRPESTSNKKGSSIYTLPNSVSYVQKLLTLHPEYRNEINLFLYQHLYYYRVILEEDAHVRSYFKNEWKNQHIFIYKNPLFYRFIFRIPLKEKARVLKCCLLASKD